MLLQTIVGAWPLDLALGGRGGRAAFARASRGLAGEGAARGQAAHRLGRAERGVRDGGARSPHRLLVDDRASRLRPRSSPSSQAIAPAGAVNGLAQTLLRLTAPGVPDLYQGTEFWDFSLVDPGQPAAGRFRARARSSWAQRPGRSGAPQAGLDRQALGLRKAVPDLFAKGSYEPVVAHGPLADHVVAFVRRHEAECYSGCGASAADSSGGGRAGRYLFGITAGAQVVQRIGREVGHPFLHVALQQVVERLACGTFVHISSVGPFPKLDLPRKKKVLAAAWNADTQLNAREPRGGTRNTQ